MLVTAQRVKSTEGEVGINTYYHVHGDHPSGQNIDWGRPDAAFIADAAPGRTVSEKWDIRAGGNMVMSYLDVACSDDTPTDAIRQGLDLAREQLQQREQPLNDVFNGAGASIGIRYGYQYSLVGECVQEFDDLAVRILDILEHPPEPVEQHAAPFKIRLSFGADTFAYALNEESKRRLRARHGGNWNATRRVTVSSDTMDDFQRIWGDIIPHVACVLTDLTLNQLALAGGVEVYDERTGQVLWEWPAQIAPAPS